MYEEFYHFQTSPFSRDIPTENLFDFPEMAEVVSRMQYVCEKQLFAVLTGDCGTGKTTALRKLNDLLDPRCYRMMYVSDSRLTPREFYRILLEQLGIVAPWNSAKAKGMLHEKLSVMKAVDGIKAVCVVDEAHLLSFAMLEEIRFLLNMKFDSLSPIALILAGQPELWERRLSLKKCEAIYQRIDVQSVLNHFDREKTGAYIRHQLSYAGTEAEIFTERSIDKIFEFSKGIARTINKVCTSSLLYGSQNRLRLIDDHALDMVIEGEFA